MRVGGSRSTGSWKSPAILPFFARQLLVNFNFKRRVRGEVDRALAFPQRPGDFRLRLLSARAGKVSFLTSWDFCQRTSRTICGVTAGDTDFRAVVGSAACEKHEADATCRGPLLPDVIQDGGGLEARCLRTNAESRPSDVKGDCPSPSAHLRPTDDQAQGLKFDLAHVKTPVPPTWRNLGANVQHILVEKSELLSSIVGSKLHLSQEYVEGLLRFGAIHWSKIPVDRQRNAVSGAIQTPAALASPTGCNDSPPAGVALLAAADLGALTLQQARAEALRTYGNNTHLEKLERAVKDGVVPRCAYIRVHVNPKRFPAVYSVAWKDRILREGADWVVIDKPGGVPSVPTVDNILENALHCAAQALGREEPLYTTSRLDGCTSGVLVLGKTPAFVAAFNQLLRADGAVQKRYRALTKRRPPLGTAVHYVTVNVRRKGWPSYTLVHAAGEVPQGSLRCELHVTHVEHVALSGPALQLVGSCSAYESEILLVTGRTHQIRAQFAALGCPIVGDTLYNAIHHDQEGGTAQELPRLPEGAIGLQAWQLEVGVPSPLDTDPCSFTAGPPWWRAP